MKKGWIIGCGVGVVLLVVCGGFVTLIVSGVLGIFALTQPVVDASDEFLNLVGQGKIAEAYASTSQGFRAQQNEASFAAAVKKLGLDEYSSVSWQSRNIKNQEGSTAGTVTTKGGGTNPVAMQLVHEGDKWKVVSVRYAGVDLASIKADIPVPDEPELKTMTLDTLIEFNKSVKANDFTTFYNSLSDTWKKQTSPEKLQEGFKDFVAKKIDIDPIRNFAPQFGPPASVDHKGVLVIAGHYPTKPSQVRFNLRYVQENAAWKLIAIQLNVGKEKS